MADLETTQSKLRSTPTAGVAGEHSAYYRRLLSAGYKGYIQGSIGGATLYGLMGLAVGGVTAMIALPFVGGLALAIIPAVAGLGVMHGASTFADIGKTAAIIAESADTNEKRRYLLDRYYDPSTGEEEAKIIRQQLEEQLKPQKPERMFHWRTVAIGAALGGVIALGVVAMPFITAWLTGTTIAGAGAGVAATAAAHAGAAAGAMGELGLGSLGAFFATGAAHLSALGIVAIGTGIGTVAGGLIGLDREYVRRWLDGAENVVNDPSRAEREIAVREREVTALGDARRREHGSRQPNPVAEQAAVPATAALAKADTLTVPDGAPDSRNLREAVLQDRVTQLQQLLQQ